MGKKLVFLCDINRTITGYERKNDDLGNLLSDDILQNKEEKRKLSLQKLVSEIEDLKKVEGCNEIYFSFVSVNEIKEVMKRIKEIKYILDEAGINLLPCGCINQKFHGYVQFDENNKAVFKEYKAANCKIDLIKGILENFEKTDCVIYADDAIINRIMVNGVLEKQGFQDFSVLGTEYENNGIKKWGIKGLVMNLEEFIKKEKNKIKR